MKLKHTVFALSLIGLSVAAIAGTPGNNMVLPSGVDLTAPDSTGIWSLGIEGLYVQSNNSFQYSPLGFFDANNKAVGNEWNWGIEADVGYQFAGSSRDVNLSYTYLGFDALDSTTTPALSSIIGTGNAYGKVDQELNAVSLTFGQLFLVGSRIGLHPFAGVQFADINSNFKSNTSFPLSIADTEATYSLTNKLTSDFTGAGPRAGIDATLNLGCGFSVVGTFAGALLVGEMDAKNTFMVSFLSASLQQVNKPENYTAMVPELDAKLGINYAYTFNPKIAMDAQIGFEAVNYFNALDSDLYDIQNFNSVNNTTNFNYYGPYFRLQLNVA